MEELSTISWGLAMCTPQSRWRASPVGNPRPAHTRQGLAGRRLFRLGDRQKVGRFAGGDRDQPEHVGQAGVLVGACRPGPFSVIRTRLRVPSRTVRLKLVVALYCSQSHLSHARADHDVRTIVTMNTTKTTGKEKRRGVRHVETGADLRGNRRT